MKFIVGFLELSGVISFTAAGIMRITGDSSIIPLNLAVSGIGLMLMSIIVEKHLKD